MEGSCEDLTPHIRHFLRMLQHSSTCNINCKSKECTTMKRLITHGVSCLENCLICKRYNNLIHLHSERCRIPIGHCSVNGCTRNHSKPLYALNSFLIPPSVNTTPLNKAKLTSVCPFQRLILLQHAAACKHVMCGESKSCSQAKENIQHVTKCDDRNCTVPFCASSKFVLAHYSECIDSKCVVCAPLNGGSYVMHHMPFCSECSLGSTFSA